MHWPARCRTGSRFPKCRRRSAELRNRGWKLAILSNESPRPDRRVPEAARRSVRPRRGGGGRPVLQACPRSLGALLRGDDCRPGHHVHVAASLFHDVAPGKSSAANDLGQSARRAGRAGAGPRAARSLGAPRHRRRAGSRMRLRLVRAVREDEVEAAADVLNEHSRRLWAPPTPLPRSCAKVVGTRVDFPDNVLVAELEGRLVGYADVIPRGETAWLDVRGTDSRSYDPLLEAIARRADTLGRDNVRGWAPEIDRDLQELTTGRASPVPASFGWRSTSAGTYRSPMARRLLRPSSALVTSGRRGRRSRTPCRHLGIHARPVRDVGHWNMGEYFNPSTGSSWRRATKWPRSLSAGSRRVSPGWVG